MEDTQRTFPTLHYSDGIEIRDTGDLLNMVQGPGRQDHFTPEAAQEWTQALIEKGYTKRHHGFLEPTWFRTWRQDEPPHVTSRLHGIARMSLRSPGSSKRR